MLAGVFILVVHLVFFGRDFLHQRAMGDACGMLLHFECCPSCLLICLLLSSGALCA
jgi:hypothetical protein